MNVLKWFVCLSEDTGGQHCSAARELGESEEQRLLGLGEPSISQAQSLSYPLHSQEAGGEKVKVSSLLTQAGLRWAVWIS